MHQNGRLSFLHRVSLKQDMGVFVTSTADRLRRVPFLDGRDVFWDEQYSAPLNRVDVEYSGRAPAYIFHVSFCGSTQLATLIDTPGTVAALKEPQALIDAADWLRVNGHTAKIDVSRVIATIEHNFVSAFAPDEDVVVKPSNWANNLIPLICAPVRIPRAVFVSMPQYDFLKAVFRGGRERMAYVARLAAHLATAAGENEALKEAVGMSANPLEQIARLAVLSHNIQENLFRIAGRQNGWSEQHWVSFDEIVRRPVETVLRVNETLGMKHTEKSIIAHVEARSAKHAKAPNQKFSIDSIKAVDREVEHHHGDVFHMAMNWCDRLDIGTVKQSHAK